MNEKLKEFITSMGVLCEIWTVTYNNFIAQGMAPKDAMIHTQGFTTALINGAINNGGGKT